MNAITTNPTRRAILGGAAVAATMPTLALAADNSRDGVGLDFKQRVATYRAKRRAADRFEEQELNPARARYFAARDAVPHVTLPDGKGGTVSTDDAVKVSAARALARFPMSNHSAEVRSAHRQLVEAADRRDGVIERLQESTGWRAADDHHSEVLSDAAWDALAAVEAYPPQNLAELHAKLSFLVEVGASESDETLPRLLADMARLLAKA